MDGWSFGVKVVACSSNDTRPLLMCYMYWSKNWSKLVKTSRGPELIDVISNER